MVLMQPRHSAYRPASLSTVSTILQPCAGGLEYIARMISVIWDLDTRRHTSHVGCCSGWLYLTLVGSSLFLNTTVRLPALSL